MPVSKVDAFVGDRRLTVGLEVAADDPLVKERPELFDPDAKPAPRKSGK